MKKKLLSGVFALALLVTAGYGVSQNLKSDAGLSDLALMNVEALASGESGGSSLPVVVGHPRQGWLATPHQGW